MITRSARKQGKSSKTYNDNELSHLEMSQCRVRSPRQTPVNSKKKVKENEKKVDSPVFNIHIHVSPSLGQNMPATPVTTIQPSIHFHFDELLKNMEPSIDSNLKSMLCERLKSSDWSSLIANVSPNSTNITVDCDSSFSSTANSGFQNLSVPQYNSEIVMNCTKTETSECNAFKTVNKLNCANNKQISKKEGKTKKEIKVKKFRTVNNNEENSSLGGNKKEKFLQNLDYIRSTSVSTDESEKECDYKNIKNSKTSREMVNMFHENKNLGKLKKAFVLLEDITELLKDKSKSTGKFQKTCNGDVEMNAVANKNRNVSSLKTKSNSSSREANKSLEVLDTLISTTKFDSVNKENAFISSKANENEKHQALSDDNLTNVKEFGELVICPEKCSSPKETPRSSLCTNRNEAVIPESTDESKNSNEVCDDQAFLTLSRKKGDVYSMIYKSDSEDSSTQEKSLTSLTDGCNFSDILKKIKNKKFRNKILSLANHQKVLAETVEKEKLCSENDLQPEKENSCHEEDDDNSSAGENESVRTKNCPNETEKELQGKTNADESEHSAVSSDNDEQSSPVQSSVGEMDITPPKKGNLKITGLKKNEASENKALRTKTNPNKEKLLQDNKIANEPKQSVVSSDDGDVEEGTTSEESSKEEINTTPKKKKNEAGKNKAVRLKNYPNQDKDEFSQDYKIINEPKCNADNSDDDVNEGTTSVQSSDGEMDTSHEKEENSKITENKKNEVNKVVKMKNYSNESEGLSHAKNTDESEHSTVSSENNDEATSIQSSDEEIGTTPKKKGCSKITGSKKSEAARIRNYLNEAEQELLLNSNTGESEYSAVDSDVDERITPSDSSDEEFDITPKKKENSKRTRNESELSDSDSLLSTTDKNKKRLGKDISAEQIGEACDEISDFEILCKKLRDIQKGNLTSPISKVKSLTDMETPVIQLECIKKEMVRRGIVEKANKKKKRRKSLKFSFGQSTTASPPHKKRKVSQMEMKKVSQTETKKASRKKANKASKKIFSQSDYIPVKASGSTKFAVAPLNEVKPYDNHDAKSFKEKMLLGNRIRRFKSNKDLRILELKQAKGKA